MIVVISNNESNNEVGASSLQERMMNQWQNLVWFSHVPKSSLLLADSFHTHTNSFIQKSMVNRGACLAIIPSACSQKLQPLHRGIKLKFKVIFFLTLQIEPAKLARPTTLVCLFSESVIRQRLNRSLTSNPKEFFG